MRRRPYTEQDMEHRRAYQKIWHARQKRPKLSKEEVRAKLAALAIAPDELARAGAHPPPGTTLAAMVAAYRREAGTQEAAG